jgi:hypothetical protein
MGKEERQEVLLNQYFFKCCCPECSADLPIEVLLKASCLEMLFPVIEFDVCVFFNSV